MLACNQQGIVQEILLDDGGFLKDLVLPERVHNLVLSASMDALGNFWQSMQDKVMGDDTMLTLSHNEKQMHFKFSGYLLKETVLLCGNTELTSTEKALEEVILINNEQANQIRLTEKKADNRLRTTKKEVNEFFLDDFSALNNELVNSKRELIRKNHKIELLNKELNAVNEHMTMFTYSVSHDLKEPVRMVQSFLNLFYKRYGGNLEEKGQAYINMALDGANKLSNMLTELLAYHQSSSFSTTDTVDLNDVFLEVIDILQTKIQKKKAQISSEILPVIKGSSAGYRQVFQNLISNAIKFVPEGKTPVVVITLEEHDSMFILKIQDNGIGIDKSQGQEAFNLFKRLNAPQQYEGTGVGLAMVKKTIERMGGKVWLESELGLGSTFHFSIKKKA